MALVQRIHVQRHQPMSTLRHAAIDSLYKVLLSRMDCHLHWCRQIVSSLPVELKYPLLHRILSDRHLTDHVRLQSLEIFLDQNTRFFSFIQMPLNHYPITKGIIEIIPTLCPNIETIDFTNLFFKSELKDKFKTLLKTCKNLQTLSLDIHNFDDAIYELIFQDFDTLDCDIQKGLGKIKTLLLHGNFRFSDLTQCLTRLPNLQSFGRNPLCGKALCHYNETYPSTSSKFNLIDICDHGTMLPTLEIFAKLCPQTKKLRLTRPDNIVVENLCKLQSLTELELYYFDSNRLIKYLKQSGENITKLRLFKDAWDIEKDLICELCPNLEELQLFKTFSQMMHYLFVSNNL